MDVSKDQFDVIPTRIQLRLDFKYWTERSLTKLVCTLGKFVKVDAATTMREKLQYARVMIEVKINQEFPDQLSFINENGIEVVIEVSYEWKQKKCLMCNKMGHKTEMCHRGVQKQVWKEKEVREHAPVQSRVQNGGEADFQKVTQSTRRSTRIVEPVRVTNSFNILNEMREDQVMIGSVPCAAKKGEGARRGDPPDVNG